MTKTIMIVEDDHLNALLFAELLRSQGFEVVIARSGADVSHVVRQRTVDLILMDLQLPDMSGFEVTRTLRADAGLRHIPIVAMTAYSMRSNEAAALASGCNAYLLKPVSIRQVLDTVHTLTGPN